jgi:hypothetical protein
MKLAVILLLSIFFFSLSAAAGPDAVQTPIETIAHNTIHPFQAGLLPDTNQLFEAEKTTWTWGERKIPAISSGRTEKLYTLAALTVADFFQTLEFLYHRPGELKTGTRFNPERVNVNIIDAVAYNKLPTNDDKWAYLAKTQPWSEENATYYDPFTEGNPLLGPRPSRERLLAFGLAGMTVSSLVVTRLPAPWSRIVLDSIVKSEELNVAANMDFLRAGRHQGPIPLVVSLQF